MDHNKRDCVYKEFEVCSKLGKDNRYVLEEQATVYRNNGFPENFKVYAPGIMLRRNTKEVIKFMRLWYEEVYKYSYRDIPSFSYTLWKNPIKINTMPFKETYKKFK